MANKKISALNDGTTAQVNDQLPIARSGSNYYITPGYIQNYIAGQANTFTTSQNVTPSSDVLSLALRRNSSGQTSNIFEIQTEANAFLAGFDKSGYLTLGKASSVTGQLKIVGTTSGAVTLSAADAAGTWTMKLPTSAGTNTYLLSTDGSGNTSWVAPPSTTLTVNSTATSGGAAGQLMYDDGSKLQESSALTFNSTNPALTLTGGTVTTSNPVLNLSQTWNAGAVAFTGVKLDVTNTASASYSKLIDLSVGGSSKFNVALTTLGNYNIVEMFGARIHPYSSTHLNMFAGTGGNSSIALSQNGLSSAGYLGFANGAWAPWVLPTVDTFLTRGGAAATLQLGAADAAAPVAQTLQVQSVVAGTTNTAGADLTINGSRGTGTGAGGKIIFQIAPAGTTGTSQNALSPALSINPDRSTVIYGSAGVTTTFYSNGDVNIGSSNIYATGTLCTVFKDIRIGAFGAYLASESSDILTLRRSTNPQIFRAYSTTTGPNYGYIASGVTDAGVATADTLFIGTGGAGAAMTKLAFVVNGTTRLAWDGGNTLWSISGDTYNSGGLYVGNTNYIGFGSAAGSSNSSRIYAPSNGNLRLSNAAGTDFTSLQFGGTSSSFPALKRSSATLAVRLADDSADAPLSCGTTTASATALNVTGTGAASLFYVTNTNTGTLLSVINSSAATIFSVNDTVTTGTQVLGTSFGLSGNISAAAWTTSGIRYRNVAATLTDTSSSGTVATAYTDVFGGNTIAASNSTTFTNYSTFRVSAPTAGTNVTLTNSWAMSLGGSILMDDATNIAVGATTGTKIGTATSQKIGFWNATPIVQPTTGVAAATVAATGTGDVVAASTTFDGYTIPQIVKALRNAGLLA